jgi:hypothetical protein
MMESPGTRDLLNKARRGLNWLRRNHSSCLEDEPPRYSDEDFGRVLDEAAGLVRTIRSLGYQGCVLGENEKCP